MHGPPGGLAMDDYVRLLNAQMRRMPPQERAEAHQELRGHLEFLIAAHEELGTPHEQAVEDALRSFGDPTRIGRRLSAEWRRSRGRQSEASAFRAAVFVACGVMGMEALSFSAMTLAPHGGGAVDIAATACAFGGAPLIAGAAAGRRFGRAAVAGTFYATLPFAALGLLAGGAHPSPIDLVTLCWCPLSGACAYLTGVARRGVTDRLSWSDLVLRLR